MRYGYFDDVAREYVITRPDTPRSWSNYSGARTYGSIITNNAGGYSFYRSSAIGRFMRLRFNSVPLDQPGRYFYLRDRDTGDYWSASWQPVGKPLDTYKSTCRFGTGYTVISSDYSGIATESTYFVPLDQTFEYWVLKVVNGGDRPRNLDLFTFCEFASEWNIFQDGFNIQYSAYTAHAEYVDGLISCSSLRNVPQDLENFTNGDQGRFCWMGLSGADVTGYDLDRETFIGDYRSYHNPRAVETGECTGSTAYGDNACGGLKASLELKPGEARTVVVLMGVGKASVDGAQARKEYASSQRAMEELNKLRSHWHGFMGGIAVKTPDADFDHMVNVWNAYNSLITFNWSRAASLVYTGDSRDGFGYRDTVQDTLGVMPLIPVAARERLELMITGQNANGGAMPEVKPFAHTPGSMPSTPEDKFRSDDSLWLFDAVTAYVAETGDTAFYDNVLPYCDNGSATVLGHLRKAIEFNLERSGVHGLPCGLTADWNDCLKLGFKGESIFVAFQLRYGLSVYERVSTELNRASEAVWAREHLAELDKKLQDQAWDGKWFLRAFRENGQTLGSQNNDEGKIFLNAQSWAVISGAATPEQAQTAMDSVEEHLAGPFGILACAPPFVQADYHDVRAVLLNPGQKENGGIFSHPQGWAVIADCKLGNGDRAFRHYRAYMPSAYNDKAEIRLIEPFVHCQSTDSRYSPREGVSHIPWLSGTASWSYFTAVQYILGVRPEPKGLTIDPCVPADWQSFLVTRQFRGKSVAITVNNPKGVQKGVASMTVNGTAVKGTLLHEALLTDETTVVVTMG